jgi:PmbA protein
MRQDQAYELFEKIRRASKADDVEVMIGGGHSALTRFANNAVSQNVAEESYGISVRSVFYGAKGARTARASTNRTDEESLRAVMQRSEELARVQSENDEMLPMYEADGALLSGPSRYAEATAAMDAGARAAEVGRMVQVAKRHGLVSAGTYASGEHLSGLFNSRGVARWHSETFASASVTMTAEDSSGWQKASAEDANDFSAERLAEVAAQKAIDSAHPREIAPGPCTVILEPAAVLDLVGFMFWDFSAAALLEERSFLNNRLGQRIFGENISVLDDFRHPLQAGEGFDGEGVARQPLELISSGAVRQVAASRASAARLRESEFAKQFGEIKPTGHGFPLPNEMGEAPINIVFRLAPGTRAQSVEQMVESTERGVLVTRTWYIREVDPYEKILTGMTRDGTFLVENGHVVCGLRNFRFNESLLHMLNNVEAMSEPVRASGEEGFEMVVPAMKVAGFNFTEVTRF